MSEQVVKQIYLTEKLNKEREIIKSFPVIPILTDRVINLTIQITKPYIDFEVWLNKENQALKRLYYIHQDRVNFNIPFDSKNLKHYDPYLKVWYSGIYEREHESLRDRTLYKHINKRFLYLDIRPIQIIKVLYAKHKISKFLYKKSIKALAGNKKIPNVVLRKINLYLSTIKSNTSKCSISAIQKQNDKRLRLKFNNHSVVIKKKSYMRIFNLETKHFLLNPNNKEDFRIYRLNKIYLEIGLELDNKLIQDNKIVFDDRQHKRHKRFDI